MEYIDLNTIYPDHPIESETYLIERFSVSPEKLKLERARATMNGEGWTMIGFKPNFEYVRLFKKGEGTMMSDTPMERNTNYDFIKKANGDVLIFGLGLGLIILPLLDKESVRSITVVELHKDLIDMVIPILKAHDHQDKLTVVHDDCFQFHRGLTKEKKWDCIYGDIWISICGDNYNEMKTLTANFKKHINRSNPDCFIDHWLKDYVKKSFNRDKRSVFGYM